MAKRTKRNKEFLILALVSVIIVVAIFVAAPTPSGYVARTVTGTVWTCEWYENEYQWVHRYDDGFVGKVPGRINADSINCDAYYWECSNNRCYSPTEGNTCVCRKQRTVAELGSGG